MRFNSRVASFPNPSGQVVGIIFQPIIRLGGKFSGQFNFSCRQWASLPYASKLATVARVAGYLPAGLSPQVACQQLDQYCRVRGVAKGRDVVAFGGDHPFAVYMAVRPAGQASGAIPVAVDSSGNPVAVTLPVDWQWGTDANGDPAPVDSSGNPIALPGGAALWSNSHDTGSSSSTTIMAGYGSGSSTSGGTSQPPVTATNLAPILNTIGTGLNVAGSTIVGIMNSNNQLQIAQLNAQTQQLIAGLQAQQRAGIGSAQVTNQLAAAQQLQALIAARMAGQVGTVTIAGMTFSTTTLLLVGAGVAAYFFLRRPRHNPRGNPVVVVGRRRGRRARRRFMSAAHYRAARRHHLPVYLAGR